MTTFQQALHIFRKDARHLRLEISGVFLLLFFLIATGVQTWEGLQRRGGPSFGSEGPLSVLLAVAWSLLIARAIQTEALPGDRHFWLTRPYSRASLVLSKALFVGAFINRRPRRWGVNSRRLANRKSAAGLRKHAGKI